PAVILGLHWHRGNGAAVVASFTAGILVLALWGRLPLAGSVHSVFPAVFLSLLAYVGLAVTTPAVREPGVAALFADSGSRG
ncbi:MAG: hypothetical protein R3190_09905, partial [Thermoanaerobaculia bacterium]|nr:hypothetical protein [Thermoanaerobaculia bacterium]